MAVILPDKLYVGGVYLDANISVADITELSQKALSDDFFLGMEVKMPEAFYSVNDNPYPIDFWSTPYGEDTKWEIKSMPSIETVEDLENIKRFVENFKSELGYYPLNDGFEFLVDGEKYVFDVSESGQATYTIVQSSIDSLIADAVDLAVDEAVNKVTSGASEAFDTLKEVEDWIINDTTGAASMANNISALKAISADTRLLKLEDVSHSHSNKALLDTYTQTESDLADAVAKKHAHENKAVLDGITAVKVSAWDAAEANAISSAKTYTDSAITVVSEDLNWILVEGEKQKVRNWRGTRANYELLVQNSAVSPWTRYVVIDTINGKEVITEYYGQNQVAEATGQLLPVKDIIGSISEITPQPYDRYLVGSDGQGYQIYEYVIEGDFHKWLIKPFDYRYGVRVIERGLKNYVYVNNVLKTYDDVDCGSF